MRLTYSLIALSLSLLLLLESISILKRRARRFIFAMLKTSPSLKGLFIVEMRIRLISVVV